MATPKEKRAASAQTDDTGLPREAAPRSSRFVRDDATRVLVVGTITYSVVTVVLAYLAYQWTMWMSS